MKSTFSSYTQEPEIITKRWSDLCNGTKLPTINFKATGNGWINIHVGINYVPVKPNTPKPINSGLVVEKTISVYKSEIDKVVPYDSNTPLVLGQIVKITIQINSQVDINGVQVIDPIMTGLKVNKRLSLGIPYSQDISLLILSYKLPFSWLFIESSECTLEIKDDYILYTIPFISTEKTFSYYATVITPGTFTLPQAKAFAIYHPEIMGMSSTLFPVTVGNKTI
eukprot:NODE_6526_length_875_cov_31.912234_g5931_i0.p1 GENE.NODE_6526_length_875_cov_31.912234_g5931_i0~~NODE_6526_length_875_cov_31.912234_g5931_i0.p1  ORF type:complete len:259 (-),score=34.39 NODE_6526_length_875_cov_31.912234_g5931_i0:99-770(-)